MTAPRNNPTELAPKLEIFDDGDVLNKTFETAKIAASPTQDITITDIVLEWGVGTNWGKLVFLINDDSNALTKNSLRRESTIERLWRVKLQLGKNIAGLQTWFDGKILETEILRPQTGRQQLMITCVGWGDVLRNRITKLIRNQDKLTDGLEVDVADTSTTIDELIMDLTNDTEHQIDDNLPVLSSIVFDNTDSEKICSTCLNIQIPNVNMTYSSYASVISRLLGLANMMWYVDPDRDLIARDPFAHDSEFLFTNDLGSLEEQGWDATKLGYIIGAPVSWTDSAAQSYYNFIHGVGPFAPLLDDKNENVPDASNNLDTTWQAVPFAMKNDNLFKIAIKAIKTGTPYGIAEVLITGGNLTTGPNIDDTRRTIKLNSKTLQALPTSVPAPYFEIPVKPRLPVEPEEQLFIVFKRFGTAADTYNMNYFVDTTAGSEALWDSTTGAPGSWTQQITVGQAVFRAWSGRRVEITVENINLTKLLKEPREKLIPLRADMELLTARQALIAASSALGKSQRSYSAITITAPDTRPPLLKFCKIVDAKTGLSIKANMIGMNLEMHSQSPSGLGTDRYTLMMEDLF